MFAFIDEAGDAGLKLDSGSSRFFTVAMVVFRDEEEMRQCDRAITRLRAATGRNCAFEFHFYENTNNAREAFLKTVSRFNYLCLSVTIDKAWMADDNHNNYFGKERLYMMAMTHLLGKVIDGKEKAYCVADYCGSRSFHEMLAKQIKNSLKSTGQGMIRRFRFGRSSQDNLLQLADYIAGMSHRKAAGKVDVERYLKLLLPRRIEMDIWPK